MSVTLNAVIVDDENYSITLSQGIYEFKDGTRIDVSGYNGRNVVVHKDLIDGIRQVNIVRMVTRYVDASNGEMTPEGHQMALEMLENAHRQHPDDLDAEFAYRKFKMQWHPVSESREVYSEPFSINVLSSIKSSHPNKWVTSSFAHNVGYNTEPYFAVNQAGITLDVVMEVCEEQGLEYVTDGNRELQWTKIRHNKKDYHPFYNRTIYSTVVNMKPEDVDAKIKHIQKHTRDLLTAFILKEISPVPLTPNMKSTRDVLVFLDDIYSSVVSLDVKQKSYTSHNIACRKINEFRTSFIESLKNKEESE